MKKKVCLVLIASSMVLSGCWFKDMWNKWFINTDSFPIIYRKIEYRFQTSSNAKEK